MSKTPAFIAFFIVMFSTMCYFLISGNNLSIGFARERGVFNQIEGEYTDSSYLSERQDDREGYVTIPLPSGLNEENVTIDKDIYGKETTVTISPVEQDYYHKNLLNYRHFYIVQ